MAERIRLVKPDDAAPPAEVPATFEEFFRRERVELFGSLCLVTRNRHEAEELTQDAFVRVLEHWDRVRTLENPRAYLYRTAMNAFRGRLRRAATAARRNLGLIRPDDEMAVVDAQDAAIRALATLSPRQRAVVVLTDLLGYTSEEAASMLGIRASTARVHASRAHALLKATMTDG
jgi:RNA polymerase sigma-70 factor (ECF subfamily)